MTKQELKKLALTIRTELNKNGESPDYYRGVKAIANEIAWLIRQSLRYSPRTTTQNADDFLTTCSII